MSADQVAGGFCAEDVPTPSGSRIRRRLDQLLAGVLSRAASRQATPAIPAAPRHPVADPLEQAAHLAQAGEDFVASFSALDAFAQEREDSELFGYMQRMRATLAHWLTCEVLAPAQLDAEADEMAMELMHSFQKMAELGVRTGNQELLRHLRHLQVAWVRWADESAHAVGVA